MTKDEKLQKVFHAYLEAHDGVPHGTYEIAAWAVRKGLLEVPEVDPMDALAEQMGTALRNEYAKDPKTGKRFRKNHAVRYYKNGVQLALWGELETAPRSHMLAAFQQRRKQIVGDCVQLKTDVDVYNGMNANEEPIQLVLDFTDDVAEIEAADDVGEEAA
jgi:hypothetical protein